MMVFLHFSFAIVAILGFTLRKGVNIEKSIAIQNVGHTLCDGVIVLYGTLKSRSISETALSSTERGNPHIIILSTLSLGPYRIRVCIVYLNVDNSYH